MADRKKKIPLAKKLTPAQSTALGGAGLCLIVVGLALLAWTSIGSAVVGATGVAGPSQRAEFDLAFYAGIMSAVCGALLIVRSARS